MVSLMKGKVHVYTGDGKGKTCAAIGLAMRASGAGLRVCIYQFIKNAPSGELKSITKIRNIRVEQCGRGLIIRRKPDDLDIGCAKLVLKKACADIAKEKYDLVILDEANIAMKLGLIKIEDVCKLIKNKPDCLELVLTGRSAPKKILALADYVTCFSKIKHPFDEGIPARRGIEY